MGEFGEGSDGGGTKREIISHLNKLKVITSVFTIILWFFCINSLNLKILFNLNFFFHFIVNNSMYSGFASYKHSLKNNVRLVVYEHRAAGG